MLMNLSYMMMYNIHAVIGEIGTRLKLEMELNGCQYQLSPKEGTIIDNGD